MEKGKKSVVGHAEVYKSLSGVSREESNVSSVKTVGYYLPEMIDFKFIRTGLCGLENGSWKGRPSRR